VAAVSVLAGATGLAAARSHDREAAVASATS